MVAYGKSKCLFYLWCIENYIQDVIHINDEVTT